MTARTRRTLLVLGLALAAGLAALPPEPAQSAPPFGRRRPFPPPASRPNDPGANPGVNPGTGAASPPTATAPFNAQQARAYQKSWAAFLKREVESTDSAGIKLVLIPPGRFLMGSPEGEKGRDLFERQHKVTITRPFLIGATPVTQAQWQAVMDSNPSQYKGDDLPVENVSWDDALRFCMKMSRKEGKTYRLPTEAQWEYACRAGTVTPFNTGDTLQSDQANFNSGEIVAPSPAGEERPKTTPVTAFKPNAWGLYDMHGNVSQWCGDWLEPYTPDDAVDPAGPRNGEKGRVLRGGNWSDGLSFSRSANRMRSAPGNRSAVFGLRVVVDLDR